MRRWLLTAVIALVAVGPALPAAVGAQEPLELELPDGRGRFYKQANGQGGRGELGYAGTNDGGVRFWDEYRRLGGPAELGYPASRRFEWDGFTVQVMQKVVFQWRPELGRVMFVNVLDRMHELGLDPWLASHRQTPPPFDTAPDVGLPWEGVLRRHWDMLEVNPAIGARYWADPAPLDHYGLPMGYADAGNAFVIRAQRAVFQQWKEDVPWARRGEVTIANVGDIGKEAGLFPRQAIAPEPPPGSSAPPPGAAAPPAALARDWRAPGFVAAVGGQLYDRDCVPLRSVGSNVPNLPFREGLIENLAWLRQRNIRWMRVFATGHSLSPDRAPGSAAAAAAALGGLLRQVEAYNAVRPASEAIYVLVSLTDYYPPGVPGDRHAFDHPTFRLSPVLPAPWFRAGTRFFDFEQEHGLGRLTGLPNYEVTYLPWVRQVVAGLAHHRALMGWQLGNELKARGSPRNGIGSAQAYGWYLDFTREVVDQVRAADRNHLIFMGAQYVAELVDWEYRPKGQLDASMVGEYRRLVERALGACGVHCWNVWGMTAYDFNLYTLDDAELFGRAGVPVVATEYGFTLEAALAERYGGDRAAAIRAGLARAWAPLEGPARPALPGAAELVTGGLMDGVAPWGSPAPGPGSAYDADPVRGIAGAPDEGAVWAAWAEVGARLEAANRAAGPSAACLALDTAR